MLSSEFIFLAVTIRFSAGLSYLRATWLGRVQPNSVTWFFWALAPLVAFFAQIQKGIAPTAWMTLALGIGPLLVFLVSLTKSRRWKIGIFDILCGAAAAAGIVLWQITSNPELAIIFGILADILGGVPTVRKAYWAPHTEKALPYFLSASSMVVTLLTVQNWQFVNYAFPVYIFLINVLIFTLVQTKMGAKRQPKTRENP